MKPLAVMLVVIMILWATALAEPVAQPVTGLVAVVPEGFWRFVFHTEGGDHAWCVFVTRDTIMTADTLEVAWAGTTDAVIWFTVPALQCTAFTFQDPPWLEGGLEDATPKPGQ